MVQFKLLNFMTKVLGFIVICALVSGLFYYFFVAVGVYFKGNNVTNTVRDLSYAIMIGLGITTVFANVGYCLLQLDKMQESSLGE